MEQLANIANVDVEELLGEWHPLVDQLGSTEGLVSLSSAAAALRLPHVRSAAALESFLELYKARILIPLELPAILRSYRHATRNETRELVQFDNTFLHEELVPELVRASQRIGRYQLGRLRPLRDHRLLQRYLRAVEEDRAHGWHTLVYGLTLSIYSLPVLQGLVFYERQTLRGFLYTAARQMRLSHLECRKILNRLCADLPHRVVQLSPAREFVVTSSR